MCAGAWGNTYGKLQKKAIWFRAIKMAVNTSKTKFIVFRTRGKAVNPNDCALLFNNNEPGQPIDPTLFFSLEKIYNDGEEKSSKVSSD
jgi:hypothetical protein